MTTEVEVPEVTCGNVCTRLDDDGQRVPVEVRPPRVICAVCEARLASWLNYVAEQIDEVAQYVLPGSIIPEGQDVDRRTSAMSHSPSLVRLVAVDLLDVRRVLRWQATAPTDDIRGALGVLLRWADVLSDHVGHDERRGRRTARGEARFLAAHVAEIAKGDWGPDCYGEIEALRSDVGTAVGEVRLAPVGRCQTVVQTDDGPKTCGGRLTQRPHSMSVRCQRCRATWDADDLERLGLVLGEEAAC